MRSKHFSQNTLEERIEIFREYFDRDLEHFFSSQILCCGQCVDEYNALWPGTAAHDVRLQENYTTTDYFLRNSRIQDDFYPEEIERYAKELQCPNCNAALDGGEFWIYEEGFDVPKDFWDSVDEIAKLAKKSPFLLLTHKFAIEVLETIVGLGNTVQAEKISSTYFRARAATGLASPALDDFAHPPAKLVSEGRYNHAGRSMLYLATDEGTALAEIASANNSYHVAELSIQANWKILDLTITDGADTPSASLLQCLARSALCAAPRTGEGWVRAEYVFSRFVADCANHAGFEAIRYGSTKRRNGKNIVLLNPPDNFNSIATLQRVRTAP